MKKNVMVLKSLIQCFEMSLGFKVNWVKSHLSRISLPDSERLHLADLLGCSNKGWPSEYLSVPLGGSPWNKSF